MFNEKMLELIKEHIKECTPNSNTFQPKHYPDIPEKQKKKAIKNFVPVDEFCKEEILLLLDTSLFDRCKNGLAFTDLGVYFKDIFTAETVCFYKDWKIDESNAAEILGITEYNELFSADAITEIVNGICKIKQEEKMFEKEAELAAKKPKDDDDDEFDSDDDDDFSLLDIIDVALDVTQDPM